MTSGGKKNPILRLFTNIYRYCYSALPTNSQFTERGVKESRYISLGRHSKKNLLALTVTRAHIIPDAMAKGKDMVAKGDEKKRLVQGKV